MDLDLERFSQLGNILLVARQEEDYRERKLMGFITYTLIAVNAGKKAPSPQDYQRKQKLHERPELEYLWEAPKEKQGANKGSAEKAAHQLRKADGKADGKPGEPVDEEDREAIAEEWGSMSVADLAAYKAQKNRGL